MKLSVVILTKNEEQRIQKCLSSLAFADELIVIDDCSTDETVTLAKNFGAMVVKRKLDGDFARQRNFGLAKAKGEWVLFIDTDEVVSGDLAKEILKEISKGDKPAYKLRRVDYLFGKVIKHGEVSDVSLIRLGRNPSTSSGPSAGKWKRKVHETWDVQGEVSELSSALFHYPHQTIKEFVDDINFYSTLHAQQNRKEGKESSIFKVIVYPTAKFLNNYILKLGFLDGVEGFVLACLMSYHSFLAWSKQWIMQKKRLIGKGLIFLFLILLPFGQLLRADIYIFSFKFPILLIDLVAFLSLVYVLIFKAKTPKSVSPLSGFVLAALFSLLLSLGFFELPQVIPGAMYLLRLISYFALLITTTRSFTSNQEKKKVFAMLLFSLVVICVFGGLQYYIYPDLRVLKVFGWDDHLGRLVSTLLDPGFSGILMVFGFVVSYYKYLTNRKLVFLALSFVFLTALAFTYSRASYLALVTALFVIAKLEKRYLTTFIILITFLGIVILLPRTEGAGVKLERTFSAVARVENYQHSLQIIKSSPVFGIGYNNLCLVRAERYQVNLRSFSCGGLDSSILYILATTGVVGLIILVGSFIEVIRRLDKSIYAMIFITCFWALLVHSLFVNSMFYPWVMGWMAILLGISLGKLKN